MKAVDVMVRELVTVTPDTDVAEAVRLLGEYDVSALPVVDDNGALVGIISEGDLLRREEIGTEKHRPWWLEAITPAATLAHEFAKSHGQRVEEIMSTEVAAISSANTMAKPAPEPTCKISSTGSREMMPKATRPVEKKPQGNSKPQTRSPQQQAEANACRLRSRRRWRCRGNRLRTRTRAR